MSCKWCAQGECWTHGAKGGGKAKGWGGGGGGKGWGGGGGGNNQAMMAMVAQMMQSMGSGKGNGRQQGLTPQKCKWCLEGECWNHKDSKLCSIHGKVRSLKSMEEDGMGGFKCKGDSECQMGKEKASTEQYVCSVHGKTRSMQSLEADGSGGFKCAAGFTCKERAKPY
eukprot:TRINITY_DN4024_c0_g5_i1.p1 TRINITY_DN4024_c0_g5~~TRINITY_DN4024_c0_g5_i1.p1  ORF type:complete len:168 (-),score=45.53 TRINITY_DN4024_c0_g5_i1:25-528(-)